MILRFLLFGILAIWIFRIGSSIIRLLFSNNSTSNPRAMQNDARFSKSGATKATKEKSPGNYRGGEYIDFEEVE